ncbi:roadblock/LC7 domain-containing protein [Diaphorobacter ruginosibacter]|uniref:Roadblock/LC7 domain-containing protein n=1 Tax=Diaphorobacter ruginosibacter TaxID=1715720 RepID=A0A7G9RNP0_9BURK|nr:roadblock/LC7 domain-containing protein [Diaphorobacter ruginosibacter]QNN57215.1 roadblock/LC7 domain-containing protein [Diaphorobacter ruginosibacter]
MMSKASTVVPPMIAATGRQILQEIFGPFSEVQTALLSTPDGFVIATHGAQPHGDGAQMAAMAGSMMAMARAVASEIGHADTRRLTFETNDGTAIFQNVPSDFPCILCLVVSKDGVLGRALWAVSEASAQMASRLHL